VSIPILTLILSSSFASRRREFSTLIEGKVVYACTVYGFGDIASLSFSPLICEYMDYSRFDNIGNSDDESDEMNNLGSGAESNPSLSTSSSSLCESPKTSESMTPKSSSTGRLRFEHEGRLIYEWEQSLEECNIYINPPPGISGDMVDIKISFGHLSVGLKGCPPFLDEDTGGIVKVDESLWTIDEGEINVNLQKMNKAEVWECALKGRSGTKIDAYTKEGERKKMLLERFQEEHPGFDFSGAEFNGNVPEAREFMGGVSY
jgi:hypothetical protein